MHQNARDQLSSQCSETDQQEGLLFEAGNQQALTDALHYMATNPEQAQKMGRQARQRLIEKYSLSKHKADLLGLYQELTETQS